MIWVWLSFVIVIGGWLIWIRNAPDNPKTWHVVPEVVIDQRKRNSIKRLVETGPDGLARLHKVAMESPRTTVLAGSVDEGMVTYITRTKRLQFPDYTTAHQDGDMLKIFARARYGHSDRGVNTRRVQRWLTAIEPG